MWRRTLCDLRRMLLGNVREVWRRVCVCASVRLRDGARLRVLRAWLANDPGTLHIASAWWWVAR